MESATTLSDGDEDNPLPHVSKVKMQEWQKQDLSLR